MSQCTAKLLSCLCQNLNCDKTHVCACGGSWYGDHGTESFEIYRLPWFPIGPTETHP